MKTGVVLILSGLVMAGCASSGGTTKSCVTEVKNPDGSSAKVVVHLDKSDPVANGFCEGDYASTAEVTAAMFGKAPAARAKTTAAPLSALTPVPAAASPKPAASTLAPTTKPARAARVGAPDASCNKTLTGGTGYACTLR